MVHPPVNLLRHTYYIYITQRDGRSTYHVLGRAPFLFFFFFSFPSPPHAMHMPSISIHPSSIRILGSTQVYTYLWLPHGRPSDDHLHHIIVSVPGLASAISWLTNGTCPQREMHARSARGDDACSWPNSFIILDLSGWPRASLRSLNR